MSQNGKCECKAVQLLASDANCPIELNDALNEYNIVSRDEVVRYRLYNCFHCGGRLPDSHRNGLFTEPSEAERHKVEELATQATSLNDLWSTLGKPDKTIKLEEKEEGQDSTNEIPYVRHYLFSKIWKTLELTVRERQDGSFDLAFTGKLKPSRAKSVRSKKTG